MNDYTAQQWFELRHRQQIHEEWGTPERIEWLKAQVEINPFNAWAAETLAIVEANNADTTQTLSSLVPQAETRSPTSHVAGLRV